MNYYKNLKIVKPNDTNHCIHELNMLLDEVRLLQIYLKDNEDNYDVDNIINDIQVINNKLSSICFVLLFRFHFQVYFHPDR